MKQFILIIIGIVLAILQISTVFYFHGIGLQIAMVGVVGLAFVLSGNRTIGIYIILSGSIVLDIFSPYRPGIYLLEAVLALLGIDYLAARSFELNNPLILLGISVLTFIILNLVQFILDPNLIVLASNVALNSFLTIIVSIILGRTFGPENSSMKIGEDVHFR